MRLAVCCRQSDAPLAGGRPPGCATPARVWAGEVWWGPTPPRGMKDLSDTPQLTEAMLRRGWPVARIRKFPGENLLRVFRQVCVNFGVTSWHHVVSFPRW